MKKNFYYLLLLLVTFSTSYVSAQSVVQASLIPGGGYLYNSTTAAGSFVFGVKNHNSSDIVITTIGNAISSTFSGDITLWYNPTTVTGAPGPIDAGNGWISVKTVTATNASVNTVYDNDLFSGLNITIPAGAVYRFAMSGPPYAPLYIGAGNNTANSYKSGGLEICTQDNPTSVGYGGAFPSPTNTPRGTAVRITFLPTNACTGIPAAGDAVVTVGGKSQSWVCGGNSFTLDLTANSIGTGQTYRWQSSTDNVTWSTYISAASPASALVATQAANTVYYRGEVTCGANVSYSTSVAVTRINAMAGIYTINPTLPTAGTNFQSFDDVAGALGCGIGGAVVFNVEPGSSFNLTAPLTIPLITGVSATNTITFNGNGSTFYYNTSTSASRTALLLSGAKHITIDSFNIDVSAGTYGWGIQLTGQADSNTIKRNTIISSKLSTLSNYAGIVISGSATSATTTGNNGNGNLIEGNKISGGYYGIIVVGASATPNDKNIIRNNTIEDYYYYGIYSSYQTGLTVKANDITRPTRPTIASATASSGIYLTTGSVGALVDGNRIHHLFSGDISSTSINSGIYVATDGTMAEPNRVVNNLVYNIEGNGTFYGLYNSGAAYMQAYHNTLSLDYTAATAGTTYGFYQTTSDIGIEFINNIVYITRGGTGVKYGIYKSTAATPVLSNNNVFFLNSAGSGAQSIGYQTAAQPTLTDWQTTSGQDLNSFTVEPFFIAPGFDFTPSEPSINNVGTSVGVATDITGAARGILPDPGAYEFDVVGSDAAISWVSPIMPVSMGSTSIKVKISNVATATINSVNLSYTDGLNQVTQAFAGLNVPSLGDTTLEFTTPYNITGNTYLRAFINLVNGSPDLTQLNDTTDLQSICFPLSGAYTINAFGAASNTNFTSFAAAAAALSCGGVSGPVVIDVAVGTGPYFNDRLVLPQITGASATNTITFNGNGETLIYSSNDANARAAILFDGADHVTIDSLVVDGESSGGTYCWGVLFTNQADSNIIRNSEIRVSTTSTTSVAHAPVIMSGSVIAQSTSGNNANYNTITNNTLSGGYHGMYLYGVSTAGSQNKGNVVSNNIIKDYYSYGVYTLGQANFEISGNDFSRPARTSTGTAYGVYLSTGTTSTTISNNRVHNMFDGLASSTSGFYAFYLSADPTAGNELQVYNNAVYNITNSTGFQYGIFNSGTPNSNIYHNTIVLDDAATTSTNVARGFYQSTVATNINFKNNIISITRSGTGINTAMYLNTPTSVIVSDNNDLYVSGNGTNYVGYHNATNYPTLTDWKTANSNAYDQASVSVSPMFVSAFTGDLVPTDAAINNLGVPVGITTDIIGMARSVTTPDPGAFEFDVAGIDASIAWESPVSPGVAGLNTIIVAVTNTSSAGAITSLKLGYTDGTTPVSQTFPGINLTAGATQNFAFTTQYNLLRQAQMQAYIELANGSPDISQANDTTAQLLCVPLSGLYTIDNVQPSSATNFASFAEAISALTCTGISGPVVFDVASGTSHVLTEQIIIPSVTGSSATNTITFKGNGTNITYTTSTSAVRSAIVLNGADHIIIDSLNIDVSGGTYGWGILLTAQADSNIIRKCTISTSTTSTVSVNCAGIVFSGSNTTAATSGNSNGNLVDSNFIYGGYQGIYVYGSTSLNNLNNTISNNTVQGFYSNGIYGVYQTGFVVKGNDISRPSRTTSTTASGIYVTTNSKGCRIEANKVHNMFTANTGSTSVCYGIYCAADGTDTEPNYIVNNLVYSIENNGTQYGIYNGTSAYMKAYHNTISLDYTAATAGTTYGFFQTGSAPGIDFRNNIVYVTRGGSGAKYCIYKSTAATPLVSNNNVLYIVPSLAAPIQAVGYQTAARTSLSDWQAASGQDANSLSVDPMFTAIGIDFIPQESSIDDLGAPVGVLTDIDGDPRSLSSPDPGAYELAAVTGIDIKPETLVSPAASAGNCYNAETITVKIKNNSQSPINFSVNPLTVAVTVTGAASASYNTVVSAGSVASSTTQDVVITIPAGTLDMSAVGTYTFKIVTSVTGDVNNGNDTVTITRTRDALAAGVVQGNPPSYCVTGGIPTLSATGVAGYNSYTWQQSTTSGMGFNNINGAVTNPYTVGSAISQTMYYRLAATCGTDTVYSVEDTVVLNNPEITATANSYTCGPGSVLLNATGTGSMINWYENATGGTSIATGNDFFTPVLASTTTYYVSSGNGGSTQTSNHGLPTVTTATQGTGVMFDLYLGVVLNSVDVYTNGTAGNVVIQLADNLGNVIYTSNTFNVPSGTLATPYTLDLNWAIPAGTGYRITVPTHVPNLGYHTGTFPVDLKNGVGTVTTGVTAAGSTSTLNYFIYNMKTTLGCQSPRVAVTATVNNDPSCVPLPVSLMSFNGNKEAEVHVLRWQTTTEVNNTGFELQRSADGITFEKIVFVASKANRGNSSVKLDYKYTDSRPLMGNNFYRLKQIDQNGKEIYSGIVLLNQSGKGLFVKRLYPNPVTNELRVQLETSASDKVTLQVTDISGKILMQVNETLPTGTTTIPMNVSRLAKGSYFLKVICSSGCETPVSKFVKQ